MDKRPIGVFDSGVGGLSVLLELKKLLPNEDFVFLADQAYVPYGEKTKTELISRGRKIAEYFLKNYQTKLIVVACNTFTCYAISELRADCQIPIVGTVPAIKPASEKTKNKVVAVMSTPVTSKSPVLRRLIKDFCNGIKVLNIGCFDLEDEVENGSLDGESVALLLQKYLQPIKNSGADHLVLGCTHYPFLRNHIRKILGTKIKLIDGGYGIAKRAKALLVDSRTRNDLKHKGNTKYVTTGDARRFSRVGRELTGEAIQAKKVSI
jgi:glutamate racemase